jgi:hypothetical protein
MFFDGLMILCFTKDKRCQVGIYTNFEDHLFSISVYDERSFRNGAIDYKRYTCPEIKQAAPLWLYVDLGDGRPKDPYSVTRFAPSDQRDPKSFDHVLDFDGPELHGPPDRVILNPKALSILNILQGLFYSAELGHFQRKVASGHASHGHKKEAECAEPVPLLNKSTLVGAQIELPKKDGLQLKLEASSGEELLSVPLEAGVRYTVYIEHIPQPPTDPHRASRPPESHFDRFYDAIKPVSGIQYDITGLTEQIVLHCPPDFPLCSAPTASRHNNLEIAE